MSCCPNALQIVDSPDISPRKIKKGDVANSKNHVAEFVRFLKAMLQYFPANCIGGRVRMSEIPANYSHCASLISSFASHIKISTDGFSVNLSRKYFFLVPKNSLFFVS